MIILSLICICASSTYLIFTKRYNHGIAGSLTLGAMAIASFVGFLEAMHGDIIFNHVSQVIYPALAIFQLRHIYIMHKRQRGCDTFTDLITLIFTNRGAL